MAIKHCHDRNIWFTHIDPSKIYCTTSGHVKLSSFNRYHDTYPNPEHEKR